jgi:tetratricopeptide (TPR) repeat protein
MSDEVMLREAIGAIASQQRERARDLLTRLLRNDQENPQYWLWMSAVVDSEKERIYCLKTVLRLDENNSLAKRGLVMFGAMPSDDTIKPLPAVQRKWEVKLEAERRQPLKIHWTRQTIRLVALVTIALLVASVLLTGIFLPEKKAISLPVRPTKTPGPPPTYTPTPTYIGFVAPLKLTATQIPAGPQPLWMELQATYTSTPLFVNTPHVINEAYRLGLLAFDRQEWQTALSYLQQAAQVEPGAPDLQYHIGETQRLQKNFNAAVISYNRALGIDKYFAPAYLGRARARLEVDPKADIITDLDEAVANDPYFGEAYLERAVYWLRQGDTAAAEKDLKSAQNLLPDSPLVYLYQAQLALRLDDFEQAYEIAQKAGLLDQTSLQVYWTLGQAALLSGRCDPAIDALETYLKYEDGDAQAWLALGRAYSRLCGSQQLYDNLALATQPGDYPLAMQAFEKALRLDSRLNEAILYRGITYLGMGEGQSAVNDLLLARKQLAPQPGSLAEPDRLWFAVNVGLCRALLVAQRYPEAYGQLEYVKNLAQSDDQKAILYYWRAQVSEKLGNTNNAIKDWKALLSLPKKVYPEEWAAHAQKQITALTMTPASTPTFTATPLPSPTKTPNANPSRTPTPTRSTMPSASLPTTSHTVGP